MLVLPTLKSCKAYWFYVTYWLVLKDVQSKSKNLSETLTFIKSKLSEEKESAEKQLQQMSIDKSKARYVNDSVGIDEEALLRKKIDHHR